MGTGTVMSDEQARMEADLIRVALSRAAPKPDEEQLRVLSWNICFEPNQMTRRMSAIDAHIQAYQPHVVLLQEMTKAHWEFCRQLPGFSGLNWSPAEDSTYFTMLGSSLPFAHDDEEEEAAEWLFNLAPDGRGRGEAGKPLRMGFEGTRMKRDLLFARVEHGDRSLVVGTSHLESRANPETRQEQMNELFDVLYEDGAYGCYDALWMGDTNINSVEEDQQVLLPENWTDAWCELRPGQAGETRPHGDWCHGKDMLRLDRCWSMLEEWELEAIHIVGTEPLPSLCAEPDEEPTWISDHFGLFVSLRPL